jgi:8-oxo-dGTP diphosphatase
MVILVTAAGLQDGQGRWLVQQRPEGKPLAGLWEFPGGKIDGNETPEAALIRELDEELGIRVGRDALMPIMFSTTMTGGRPLILRFYHAVAWVGDVKPLHAAQLRWVSAEDLSALPMPEPDVPLADAIRRRWPSPSRGSLQNSR